MGDLRNIKLTVEYEGTAYHGWQSQKDRPSVQKALEGAIARVVSHPVVVYGSGRTDRGVHALGQVANFRTERTIPAAKLVPAINTYLPEDVRVRAAGDVPPEFHARYSALGKRYRYTVLRAGPGEPSPGRVLFRRLFGVVPSSLDVEAMRRAARLLWGVHDFRAFEARSKRRPPEPGEAPRSTVRTVPAVVVEERGPFVLIDAFGLGFLYRMVRSIAGTLILVGQGRLDPAEVGAVLGSRDRRTAGFTAPPQGLCLLEVYYEEGALARAAEAAKRGARDPDSAGEAHERLLKLLV